LAEFFKREVFSLLLEADWVSLKVDTVSPNIWRKINRPHGSLSLDRILEGISDFVRIFGVAVFVFIKKIAKIEFLRNNSTRREYVISNAR